MSQRIKQEAEIKRKKQQRGGCKTTRGQDAKLID